MWRPMNPVYAGYATISMDAPLRAGTFPTWFLILDPTCNETGFT